MLNKIIRPDDVGSLFKELSTNAVIPLPLIEEKDWILVTSNRFKEFYLYCSSWNSIFEVLFVPPISMLF